MNTARKPIVDPEFCAAVRASAVRRGDLGVALICDLATAGDREAADSVGAIMHGATWWGCRDCRGSGRRGRGKCVVCAGTGQHPDHPEERLNAIRSDAFAAMGLA